MVDKWKKAPKRLSALLAAAILLACGCDSNKTKEGSTTELTSENMIESTTDKVVSTTQTFPEAVFPVVPETEGMEKSFQYTIFVSRGISGSSMGIDAISDISSVETSSPTSSSPSCLLPIIRNEIDKSRYIITVLTTIDVKKSPPFINYSINFAQ